MRAMDSLTQNLIDTLTQILLAPQEDTLAALQVVAPVLIDHLQVVKCSAVDRREIEAQMRKALDQWLVQHPQPDAARDELIGLLERELLAKNQVSIDTARQRGAAV